MKVVAKPIKVICYFDEEGKPKPLKFAYETNDGLKTVKVEQVINIEKEKLAGNYMYEFDCQSVISGKLYRYQLKYELDTYKWMLFKI